MKPCLHSVPSLGIENIILGRSQPLGSQPLLHVMARVKPASSKNMNGFHQLPALSPSKKTFTVGKANTDNNDIEFFFQQQAS